MERPCRLVGTLLLGSALFMTATPGLSAAATQDTASPPSLSHSTAVTPLEQRHTLDYWTPERMHSAVPIEQLLEPSRLTPGPVSAPAEKVGAPSTVAPTVPAQASSPPDTLANSVGDPWTGGGLVVKTSGRIFFTYQGRAAACSGSAVTSGNKDVVITAGHCVKLDGAYHTDWVFVPGYTNGNAPFGKFAARSLLTTPQWDADQTQFNYDVGIGLVSPLNGQHLTDVVGGQGLAFNQPRNQDMYAFGYPGAAPFDGSKLIYCNGPTTADPLNATNDLNMTCNMNPGSSGGPWFLNFDPQAGTGKLNSVNSIKYQFFPQYIMGPYFANEAQDLYNRAQSA
ncbi:MAG: peptidase [Kutzneria sp.]|nr:peptidase [Kutzneria sp.]MBV9844046.1 peptidase [Kutzneria sp.]